MIDSETRSESAFECSYDLVACSSIGGGTRTLSKVSGDVPLCLQHKLCTDIAELHQVFNSPCVKADSRVGTQIKYIKNDNIDVKSQKT